MITPAMKGRVDTHGPVTVHQWAIGSVYHMAEFKDKMADIFFFQQGFVWTVIVWTQLGVAKQD